MPRIAPIPFTQEGYDKIKTEQAQLVEERKDAVEHLRKARDLGDLRENGYYKASRMKLSSIDHRLSQLKYLLRYGVITEPTGHDSIGIGSRVILQENGQKRQFQIVGKYEGNPHEGKLSDISPLGRALLHKKVGDFIELEAPQGKKTYQVIDIQ